jgi:hypothetical protein
MPSNIGKRPALFDAIQKFGRTPNIDRNATNEEIWDATGAYGGFLAAAIPMSVSSSSTDDIATTGTGAWTVRVVGLDSSWVEVSQDVSLNGQTGVALPTPLLRVYQVYVVLAGTGVGENAGDIWIGSGTVTAGVPANKYAGILTNVGETLMAVYSVPTQISDARQYIGGQIVRWYATCVAPQKAFATVALQTREFGEAWRTRRVVSVSEGGGWNEEITWGIEVRTRADVRIRALTNGANNTSIEAGFDIALRQKV